MDDDGIQHNENGVTGVPAEGVADVGAREPLGRPGLHHWRESTITKPGLDDRGSVFFAAIEMTRMPMILTDPNQPDNPIAFANKAFLDLTGYEEEEVLGRNCRFLQGAGTDRESVAELREAIANKGSIALELLNYRRDGSAFWNAVFIGPVYNTDGELLYFFASQLDVTRRRDSEQAFRQTQKMESIGQLTAGLAHDFNNLLQVVNGNLELLAARATDDRTRRYVENARSAAERGAKLTRQLLAFARKTRLAPEPYVLGELVRRFDDVLASALGSGSRLSIEISNDLPQVLVDAEQLEMALLNIVMNARDAMPGGGKVTISAKSVTLDGNVAARELAPGDYVALEIRDEGSGMPPEVAERAAEPFFTTKEVGRGTGLGLAMASGFARQSRGRLDIESQQGSGTTVRLLFPVTRRSPSESVSTSDTRELPAPHAEPATERILVVEDSAEVLDLAREILEAAGYSVATAMSGEEGLQLFETEHAGERFDLLFTDLVMPGGMNGLALADAVTRHDPGVSVLLTTGYNEELSAGTRSSQNSDVLSKPYRRAELLDRVRQALNRRGEGGARRTPSDFGAARE